MAANTGHLCQHTSHMTPCNHIPASTPHILCHHTSAMASNTSSICSLLSVKRSSSGMAAVSHRTA
eukprot:10270463-Lingulodinium_polyedra.AAC.1